MPTVRIVRVSGPCSTGAIRTPMFWVITGSIVISPLNLSGSSGVSSMKQIGQSPGFGRMTHGCIPQV